MSDEDDWRSNRQISRGKMRRAGDRTAKLAAALMKMREPQVKKLEVEPVVLESIERARKVMTHIARRRAERTLAGDLRRFDVDLAALEDRLQKLDAGDADAQQFHLAEQWRTKLLAEGVKAADKFPGGASEELPRLIEAAQRERDVGKPPGASRKLFRHIAEALQAQRRAAMLAAAETDDAEPDDDE
jgi:ribosome-associated protein